MKRIVITALNIFPLVYAILSFVAFELTYNVCGKSFKSMKVTPLVTRPWKSFQINICEYLGEKELAEDIACRCTAMPPKPIKKATKYIVDIFEAVITPEVTSRKQPETEGKFKYNTTSDIAVATITQPHMIPIFRTEALTDFKNKSM